MTGLPGFRRIGIREGFALLDEAISEHIEKSDLLSPWTILEDGSRTIADGSGRGPRALVGVGGGRTILLKQYLRGGWPAKVNPARYATITRFVDEVKVGREAAAAGLPVLPTVGIVLRRANPGWNAWGMSMFWEGAFDLAAGLTGRGFERCIVPDPQDVWSASIRAVSDVFSGGLYHRDLNLGNLLVRKAACASGFEARVIDLDRALYRRGPLSPRRRLRICRRIERSYLKICGKDGPISASRRREDYRRLEKAKT